MRSVYSAGGALVDPEIATVGDIDSAMTTMVTQSGRLVQINNSRFNAFGYDQRIEVYGTLATLTNGNATMDDVSVATASGIRGPTPVPTFLEHYTPAFEAEMRAFVRFAGGGANAACDHNGALAAQHLADAAFESLAAGRPIQV
jgi:myo-inositol 2-dehydrogenase/D-chiro-inositol 1-dehydrogenase